MLKIRLVAALAAVLALIGLSERAHALPYTYELSAADIYAALDLGSFATWYMAMPAPAGTSFVSATTGPAAWYGSGYNGGLNWYWVDGTNSDGELAMLTENPNVPGGSNYYNTYGETLTATLIDDTTVWQIVLESAVPLPSSLVVELWFYGIEVDAAGNAITGNQILFYQNGTYAHFLTLRGVGFGDQEPDEEDPTEVPEPASAALLLGGMALAGLVVRRRRG